MSGAAALGPPVATASPARTGARAAHEARPDAPDATDPPLPAARLDGTRAGQGDEATGADPGGPPFADLLAPPMPAPPPAVPPVPAGGDGAAPAAGADPATPGQLLALLAGYRLDAVVPATGPHATGAPAALAELAAALAPAAATAATAGQAPATGTAPTAPPHAALDAAGAASATTFPLAAAAAAPESATSLAETMPTPGPTASGAAPEVSAAAIAPAPAAARAPQAAPTLPPLALPAQPADGFDDGFGGRIAWMAGQRLGHAEIRLNPEHLGAIDVRLQLDGDQVRAEFNSANGEVRQAIEASLPRLRELLGQHGLQLGQADVGQRQPGGDADAARTTGQARTGQAGGGGAATQADAPAPIPLRTRGLVDEYA